uniref:ATP synthase subunit a n=1 Tax=Plagiorhynchus transversus TaxID=1795586 RepID=A0A140E9M6_9BILA|nr:ATP synthase F0 subunit 6 [Plagiorhynchus transversus]AMK97077.1 ATP synthase F0 subunit 6 [Plagiorhynchus transversus]
MVWSMLVFLSGAWLVSSLQFKGGLSRNGSVWYLFVITLLGCTWLGVNLMGIFMGFAESMKYGGVLLVALVFWSWGEIMKPVLRGMVEYLAHFSITGVSGLLGGVLPFMEVFSVVIRPLTLGVRLATNMTSGHVLMAMVALFSSWGIAVGAVAFSMGVFLVGLEILVCLLQALVFSMLVEVYFE